LLDRCIAVLEYKWIVRKRLIAIDVTHNIGPNIAAIWTYRPQFGDPRRDRSYPIIIGIENCVRFLLIELSTTEDLS